MANNPPGWIAPHPFNGMIAVPGVAGDFRVRIDREPTARRIATSLSKMCYFGFRDSMRADTLLNETEIWEALNAFNLRGRNSVSRPWAWISQHILDVPDQSALPVGFNWATWQPARRPLDTCTAELRNDLTTPWPSVQTVNQRTIGVTPSE
ncbi:hypothetical protein F5Y06DRAFT_299286 [Hypoxylon sp. FL0890]|nr:hypothetical protein F5Y06DRAFT_299286 [Hypoxylon sp. FL0890]